jgi:hypothetical protein
LPSCMSLVWIGMPEGRENMKKFVIQPHFRLQEWVADEKGYFTAEGLDYVFNEEVQATDGKVHDKGQKVGAYQSFESGRASDVSCACHWTEFPVRYHTTMDTKRWGPGERIVFEPYTEEAFNRSREWIAQHEIFGPGGLGTGTYEQVIACPVQSSPQ